MTGYLTNRFTAEMHIRVPAGYRVIGSGSTGAPHSTPKGEQYDFNWNKPGFPGTIIAGKFEEPVSVAGSRNIRVYTTAAHHQGAVGLRPDGQQAVRLLHQPLRHLAVDHLNIVELPIDTVPATWAPEIAAIAGIAHRRTNPIRRLLANTIAHQWWGSEVSPATLNDAWITNGMSRYGELMYLEDVSGNGRALRPPSRTSQRERSPTTRFRSPSAGRLSPFSPEFQSMTLEKGAMVFHMLRWEVGDENFKKILQRHSLAICW